MDKTEATTSSKSSFLQYGKWTSSIFLIIGMVLTAYNIFPINLLFHVVGLSGWLLVAIVWNDRSLIMLNTVALVIYANGIIAYIL